ncbi:sodium:calcium antiporter [Candidatus Nanosalina sp. VS9-1]|uniref:sodium:calcium antiporter n=1 Tax=Candidatus Nanosalina sp. VS9-1 TaxID=3388566 RepID=UPI0039E18C18
MIQQLLLLAIGFIGLWYSAERTVENSEGLVQKLGMSGFTFGAIFVSVSTGLPEIFTALVSTMQKVPELSAGDIIGSTLVNMTLILGATALTAREMELTEDDIHLIKASCATIFIAAGILYAAGALTAYTSLALTGLYIAFLSLFGDSYFKMDSHEDGELRYSVLRTGLGLVGLLVFARVTVFSAVNIGEILGIPVEILGTTVVAVGTGLPELAFEITSVKNGDYDLALGDIFGSTVVNITLVTGLLGAMNTLVLTHAIPVLAMILAVSAGIFLLSRKKNFSWIDGAVLLGLFILYMLFQLL